MRFKLSIKKGLIYCLIAMLTFGYPAIGLNRQALALADTTTTTTDTVAPTTPATITTTTDPTTTTAATTTPSDTTATPMTNTTSTGTTVPVAEAPASTATAQDPAPAPTTSTALAPATTAANPTTTTVPTAPTTANTIDNTTISTAQTGDASVLTNSTAGNATTGNAAATDTVLNNINSSTGGGGVVSFNSNVTGSVTGDIQLYPMIVNALSSGNLIASPTTVPSVASTTNNQITNNITLNAASGKATVSGNSTAGNATSGNADTVANIMNIVNSIISTNKSFVGVINIYGNLNGDILIAPDFIPQLLASNAALKDGSGLASTINNSQVINNISLNATSGTATVSGNSTAGHAISGSALTNLVLINLSGRQVIASNSLLVFVNVLGKWVGVIVDAPAGSTAAAIGSGVTQNTVAALLPAVSPQSSTTTNSTITNNVTLNSKTGDAIVSKNGTAGNATTGNSTASANVLNMFQSNFGLSGWFGVLFINVFGSWLGSFGIDTGNGTIPLPTDPPAIRSSQPVAAPSVFKFTPAKSSGFTAGPSIMQPVSPAPLNAQPDSTNNQQSSPAILGAQIAPPTASSGQSYNYTLAGFIMLAALSIVIFIVRRIWLFVAARRLA